jgi:hypothetical protein
MSKHKELPVYKASYDLMIRMQPIVRHFPREYQYSLGEKMLNEVMELVMCVYEANEKENRVIVLKEMLKKIERLFLMLRMAHDLKLIAMSHYAQLVEMMDDISRQTQGWLNVSQKPLR